MTNTHKDEKSKNIWTVRIKGKNIISKIKHLIDVTTSTLANMLDSMPKRAEKFMEGFMTFTEYFFVISGLFLAMVIALFFIYVACNGVYSMYIDLIN